MNLKKNSKIKSIILLVTLLFQAALSGVNASDPQPMYDISPSPPLTSQDEQAQSPPPKKASIAAKKRNREEDGKPSIDRSKKAVKKLSSPKIEEQPKPNFFNSALPTAVPMAYAYPAEPPENLWGANGEHNSVSSFGSQKTLNILPEFTKKPDTPLFIVPGMAMDIETHGNRPNRRDIIPRRFRKTPESIETIQEPPLDTDAKDSKLLDIIFVPKAEDFCIGIAAPILLININKNFKDELSDEDFNARAEVELRQWTELRHICKEATATDCLANIEMIMCNQKVLGSVRKVFNLRRWLTTSCKPLGLNSTFSFSDGCTYTSAPHYLDRTNLVISHRSARIVDKDYDLSSLFTVLRYFIEFPEFIRIGNLLYHPLFKDKELTDEIDKISAFYASGCDEKCVLDYFAAGCILPKITHDTYSDPTLIKMQNFFKCAAVTRDINSLMRGIGYFNLVRALNSLPFVKDRPRYKGDLPECIGV